MASQFVKLDLKFIAKKANWRTEKGDKEDGMLIAAAKKLKKHGVKHIYLAIVIFKKAGYVIVYPRF